MLGEYYSTRTKSLLDVESAGGRNRTDMGS